MNMNKQQSPNFDLNILNYKKEELEDMLSLQPLYTHQMIEINASKLRESVFQDNSIDNITREKTVSFINNVKKLLTEQLSLLKNIYKTTEADVYNVDTDLKYSNVENNGYSGHNIIERNKTPYGQSFPSEYYQGTINPLKKRILYKNLNIDTRFRDNYYGSQSTNFLLSLPLQFNDVLSLQLNAIEIPTTFYVISKLTGNNFFTIIVNGDSTVVTIPDGNYNIKGILNVMNEAMYKFDNQFKGIIFQDNISNGNGTGQIIVGINESYKTGGFLPVIESISIDFQADKLGNQDRNTPLPLKFGWLLGFRNGYYENSLVYLSEGIPDLTGPKYIYLVVDDFNNNVNNGFYSAFNSSILNNNILARISLQANTFSCLIENNLNIITTPRQYFGPVNINNLNIQLLDEYGRILDLNNTDYSFCLTLQSSYDI